MEEQYGISDLRQYINGRSVFHPLTQPPDLLSGRNLTPVQHYPDMVLVGRQATDMVPPGGFYPEFRTDSGVNVTRGLSSSGGCFSGLDMDGGGLAAGDGGTGRWPRQETLTLLEIRSRFDSKFKESNQKGPLWDEVSRIMSEEHGYQRSGKKCREKFENLYKYYKKTKDGKAGRQDGKHYRFFRQLEALCGETSNAASYSDKPLIGSSFPCHDSSAANNTSTLASNQEALQASKISESLSLSRSSDFRSTSSEDATVENDSSEKRRKRKGKRSWKVKIKDFIDSQMRKLMERQEVWLEKMMRSIEEKEQERMKREEEWGKQEAARVEREQKFWANERAWIEARDASFMDCLRKIPGKEVKPYQTPQELLVGVEHPTTICVTDGGILETLSSSVSRGESIREYLIKSSTKKRKEDSKTCGYLTNDSLNSQLGDNSYSCSGNEHWLGTLRQTRTDQCDSPLDDDGTGSAVPYGEYRYLLGDAGNLWENYGVKFSKGENH